MNVIDKYEYDWQVRVWLTDVSVIDSCECDWQLWVWLTGMNVIDRRQCDWQAWTWLTGVECDRQVWTWQTGVECDRQVWVWSTGVNVIDRRECNWQAWVWSTGVSDWQAWVWLTGRRAVDTHWSVEVSARLLQLVVDVQNTHRTAQEESVSCSADQLDLIVSPLGTTQQMMLPPIWVSPVYQTPLSSCYWPLLWVCVCVPIINFGLSELWCRYLACWFTSTISRLSAKCVHVCIRMCLVMTISAWSCSGSRLMLIRSRASLTWENDAVSLVRTTVVRPCAVCLSLCLSVCLSLCLSRGLHSWRIRDWLVECEVNCNIYLVWWSELD